MEDASVLGRLAGRSGGLRAATRTEPRRIIRAGEDALGTLEVTVAGHDGGVLRLESTDPRILTLDGRAVVLDIGSGANLLRVTGSLQALSRDTPFLVALHPVMVPDRLQRRGSDRVAAQMIVRVTPDEGPPDARAWNVTTSRDVSAGGVRLVTVGDLRVGQRVRVALDLSPAPLECGGTVLDVMEDGTSRIRFDEISGADSMRLQGFIAAVQIQ